MKKEEEWNYPLLSPSIINFILVVIEPELVKQKDEKKKKWILLIDLFYLFVCLFVCLFVIYLFVLIIYSSFLLFNI